MKLFQSKRILFWLLFIALVGMSACGKQTETPEKAKAPKATMNPAAVRIIAEGRLLAYPGAEVMVSAEQSGVIEKLPVEEKMPVKKGDLIAQLQADDVRAALAEAHAKIAEAVANLKLAQSEVVRYEQLYQKQMGTKQLWERSLRDRNAAQARLTTAQASARQIQAVLDKSRIVAPIDGVIVARNASPGEMATPGRHLVTIADLSKTRIEAEVDEFDVARIKLGSMVTVTAEGYGNAAWKGKVEEIPDTVVDRRLKPQDPGRPSDTRVLLVKIALLQPTPLKLGQRVEVEIQSALAN